MSENQFWIRVWMIGGVSLIAVFAIVATSCAISEAKIVELVEKGADPIAASCAIRGNHSSPIQCYEAAKKGRQ